MLLACVVKRGRAFYTRVSFSRFKTQKALAIYIYTTSAKKLLKTQKTGLNRQRHFYFKSECFAQFM